MEHIINRCNEGTLFIASHTINKCNEGTLFIASHTINKRNEGTLSVASHTINKRNEGTLSVALHTINKCIEGTLTVPCIELFNKGNLTLLKIYKRKLFHSAHVENKIESLANQALSKCLYNNNAYFK